MLGTLEKLKRLETCVLAGEHAANSLLDKALTKLLIREHSRVQKVSHRLQQQLVQFERHYKLSSQQFYIQYTDGQMGDAMDFIEWAASIEMLENIKKHLMLLDISQ